MNNSEESEPLCSNQSDPESLILEGWHKEEKYNLLIAIKEFGSSNIQQICELIPSKSPEDIDTALSYYKKKASQHTNVDKHIQNKKRNSNQRTLMPLAAWAKFLTDSLSFEELHTETVSALHLISEFEKIPTAVWTENIDFRKIYLILADAMEGKAVPNDEMTRSVIEKCLLDTALTSKSFIRTGTCKRLLTNLSDKEINVFPNKPTTEHEAANLRHLSSQRSYNPLNIPENYLKASAHQAR